MALQATQVLAGISLYILSILCGTFSGISAAFSAGGVYNETDTIPFSFFYVSFHLLKLLESQVG